MSSGFGQHTSGDYITITNGSQYATGAKVAAYLWEVVDEEARTVTVYCEATLAMYRTRGNWSVGYGDTLVSSYYGTGVQYVNANIDGTQQANYYNELGIKAATSFYATPGGTYTYRDGYVTGLSGWSSTVSKTFYYNQNGDAISRDWYATVYMYSEITGLTSVSVGGSFITSSIRRAYTNPSMDSATITNTVLGPYHIYSTVSGVSYGSQYSSQSLKCRVSYNLDGVSYSYDAKTLTDGSTSATCNVDGLVVAPSAPWTKVPDGADVNVTWIVATSGSGGSGSASKSKTSSMPYAYDAFTVEPGTSRSFYLFNDEKLITSMNNSTILNYVNSNFPAIDGDFDIVVYYTKSTNKYEAWLYWGTSSICILDPIGGTTAVVWLNNNLGVRINEFVANASLYYRDTQARISYHLDKIQKCDLIVSNAAGERPTKPIRRIGIINGEEIPFRGWAYLYIGKTDDEEDWVELNLTEKDWKSLCTSKDYIKVDGRKFDKSLVRGITIGEHPTSIGSHFLQGCENLSVGFEIPDGIETIGSDFLSGCISFNDEIDLNHVETVGSNFMKDCVSFNSSIDFGDVTSVGSGFLNNCTSFNQNLNISQLTTIGMNFMHNCDSFIAVLSVGSTKPNADNNVLSTENEDAQCYKIGITLSGTTTNVNSWISRFPNRTSSPYRYMYNVNNYQALKSSEYDGLNLDSEYYDDYELTSTQYDERGKTILMR